MTGRRVRINAMQTPSGRMHGSVVRALLTWVAILLLIALPWIVVTPAAAGTLLLWPVQPVFEPGKSAAALWVENRGKSPVWLQVRVFGWKQAEGEDRYHEQQDVIGSPPMMQVGPGERQLVRLIRQTPTPDGIEAAWRVILDEVPQRQPSQDDSVTTRAGVNLQMRYSLPLFSYGSGLSPISPQSDSRAATMQLDWRIVQAQGQTWVEIANHGARHVRLTDVVAEGSAGRTTVAKGLLGYVLGHSYRRWPLPSEGTVSTLTARVNGQSVIVLDQADDAP